MNQTTRIIIIIFGVVLATALVFYAGIGFASSRISQFGGMMNGQTSFGMMQGSSNYQNENFQQQMHSEDFAYGMGMMTGSMMMEGMMGSSLFSSYSGDPISIADAESAVEEYLLDLEDQNLTLSEIMIFDNHAYAQIIEEDTGIGAMEVLVDPETLQVFPEFGPNMMWNEKYGGMASFGMMGKGGMGGMMGGAFQGEGAGQGNINDIEAIEIAQAYLDKTSDGLVADDHLVVFYGYYTIHILDDGDIAGMLSVNANSGQVFHHTWHGEFIEIGDHD